MIWTVVVVPRLFSQKIEHISWIWTFHWTPVAPNQLGAAASSGTHFLLGCCPMTAGCVGQLIIATFHIFRIKILCWLSELKTPKKSRKRQRKPRGKKAHIHRDDYQWDSLAHLLCLHEGMSEMYTTKVLFRVFQASSSIRNFNCRGILKFKSFFFHGWLVSFLSVVILS